MSTPKKKKGKEYSLSRTIKEYLKVKGLTIILDRDHTSDESKFTPYSS